MINAGPIYAVFFASVRSQCRKASAPPRWAIASFIRKRNCSANRLALAAESSCLEAILQFSNG